MFQRDYILRAVELAAAAVARALAKLSQQKQKDAEKEVAAAYAALSLDRELLLLLDGPAARNLCGDDTRLEAAARVLLADSEVCSVGGATGAALRRLRAARRLLSQHTAAPPAELTDEVARIARLLGETG